MANAARWIIFLPTAFFASWLVTRFFMYLPTLMPFRDQGTAAVASVVLIFANQLASGLAFGYVGVKLSPGTGKAGALTCCVLFNIVVGFIYFLRFLGIIGFLAPFTYVMATGLGGWLALMQWVKSGGGDA